MCGLAGLVDPTGIADAAETIRKMNQPLVHRGPDQEGYFLSPDGRVALAHKRLSVIDLSQGRQPMTDADGRLTLVFNGEIYNHHELKAQLLAKGHPIRSRSDTETLLYAYKEWGADCLGRLRGMFAFAVHDRADGSVFLARDRLGIKPMYYGFHKSAVLFASECKAILAYPGFSATLDHEALSDYLSLMYVPAPKSIYREIRKLQAGHWLRISADGRIREERYWDLEFPDADEFGREKDIERGQEELLGAMEESVKAHMESDVPMGAFLSGGVDSSAVVAFMARNSSRPVLTNTIGFPSRSHDETDYARRTAALLKTDHREAMVTPEAVPVLEKLAWYYDEPFSDSSMVPTYYVCEMARRHVTVALSGDGGDENFAGYRRYYFDRLENRVRGVVPAAVRTPVFGLLGRAFPKADWLPQPLRAKTLLTNLAHSPARGYFTTMSHMQPDAKRRLLTGDIQRKLGGYDPCAVFEGHLKACRSRNPLSRIQYLDVKTYLVDDILTKVDRASMAVSLEVRVPLLDHRVMELAARMPADWKLKGREPKYIFKQALRKLLPREIFERRKTGFSMPVKEWLAGDLHGYLRDALTGEKGLAKTGLFDGKAMEKMMSEHASGLRNHDYALFGLLSLALWNRTFKVL